MADRAITVPARRLLLAGTDDLSAERTWQTHQMATCRLTHLPASATLLMASHLAAQEPIPIGSRLDAPWEGNACGQNSVFRDGDVVRVYYYAAHYLCSGEPAQAQDMSMPREAVSRDL